MTLWPVRSLPAASGAWPAIARISVVLPVPLGPTSETCSPRSSHRSASCSSVRPGTSRRPSSSSKITRPERSGALNWKPSERPSLRVALDALDLVELLDARLGLLGLRGLVAEALDEALHALDLGLLLGDRLAERHLARRLLPAPGVPRALEEARAAGLDLQHAGADGLEEPAVVRDEHDRGVERDERLLEPLERLDVEVVGRLVEQQQVGLRGERAGQRAARQLAAGERRERAVEVGLGEAEAVDDGAGAVAPRVAAGGLEARLDAGVALDRPLVALRHQPARGAPARPRARAARGSR